MAHDVPLGCAPDEYDDLISGTCSHLPKVSDKNVEFVTENFTALIKSVQLLEMYQNAITEEVMTPTY
ncbi:hypothetical protein KAM546c_27560 [Enterobacter roggenkampii]|uniref:hypothetical protein n=1 Tax=Enterobacter roggenkampii TaxID=1812935 RepID=UPI00220F832E|nr:hypothetical protein [Enterobacter roggenkampii]BDS21495.1 hypothetical protein KAM546c_27560 [Enterobacter roggenkampii]